MTVDDALRACPIVAILRGVTPAEVLDHAEALFSAGVRVIEVPLNSPEPIESIRKLSETCAGRLVCGGGTMLSVEDVNAVHAAGGEVAVSPNTDPDVIARAVELGMTPMPGVGTATEAFAACKAGARRLKLFPASSFGAGHVKALLAVLPKDVTILAVGGVGPANMAEWWAAGCRGFGLGGELYRPGQSPDDTAKQAEAAVRAAKALL
jgi:2-dehydro-3-deoxyphosphogalactonate aldolase